MADQYPEKPRYTLPQGKPDFAVPQPPARELSDDEFAITATLKQRHQELLPEFDPFVIELYKLGMIPGWRAVRAVEALPTDPPPSSDWFDYEP